MKQVSEVMMTHPEYCNIETRVPDLLFILNKYNYDEIVITDSDHKPVGLLKKEDVVDEALKDFPHPFDIQARKLMTKIPVTVKQNASIDECLKLMEANHVTVIPVVDREGHCLGTVKKEDLTSEIRH